MLEVIHECLEKTAQKKELKEIRRLIDRLDQSVYGSGCIEVDLRDFLKSKKEIAAFFKLWDSAITMAAKEYDWSEELKEHSLALEKALNRINDEKSR